MKELLVLIACSYNQGCTDAARLYYEQSPELQVVAANIERKGKQALGPVVSEYGLPVLGAAVGRPINVRLTNTLYLKMEKEAINCVYTYSF